MTNNFQIIDYSSKYKEDFKKLNLDWIEKYFFVEPLDEEVLSKPEENIIQKGGHILFAKIGDKIVGTCALINEGENVFELAKMAVSESSQGKGIGLILSKKTIEKAKEVGATKVYLVSNTKLIPALNLYKKLGFVEVPIGKTEYERTDIKMELTF